MLNYKYSSALAIFKHRFQQFVGSQKNYVSNTGESQERRLVTICWKDSNGNPTSVSSKQRRRTQQLLRSLCQYYLEFFGAEKSLALLSLLAGQIYIFKINNVLLKLVNVYSVRFSQHSAVKVNQILYYSNYWSKEVNLQKPRPNDNCQGIMSILILVI